MTEEERQQARIEFLGTIQATINARGWHWFGYHFQRAIPTPFARSIIDACIDCEAGVARLGADLVRDLGAIGGMERHEQHYEQLLQKLAEILVLRQILQLPWPEGTEFAHEPAVNGRGPRPELRVRTPDRDYLFEVKAPGLLEHARNRQANQMQAPARALGRDAVEQLAGGAQITLPRDNPIKDFLVDADRKFAPFKAHRPAISVLVIVWDDHIYEPISALVHEQCGLLTPRSYFRNQDGAVVEFANIDAVVLVRHLTYFGLAATERPLLERLHAFDFGGNRALPNVVPRQRLWHRFEVVI
jgi:hypothetical protein